jgi:hypothetical protein
MIAPAIMYRQPARKIWRHGAVSSEKHWTGVLRRLRRLRQHKMLREAALKQKSPRGLVSRAILQLGWFLKDY